MPREKELTALSARTSPSALVFIAVKVGVSAALMCLLLSQASMSELASRFDSLAPVPAVLAVVLLIAQILLNTWRWRQICAVLSPDVPPFSSAARWMTIGQTFSQVLPTSFGGDAYRIIAFGQQVGLAMATRSILADRILGLVFLALITCIASLVALPFATRPGIFMTYFMLSALVPAGILVGALFARMFSHRSLKLIQTVASDLLIVSASKSILRITAVSILHNGSSILAFVAIFNALALDDVLWWQVGVTVPGALLATIIPLSVGGWGLREAGMAFGLSGFGVSVASALALSVTYGLLVLVLAIPGALLWIVPAGKKPH